MTALVQRDNSIARAITSGISASSQAAEKDIPKRYKDYFRLSRRTLESARRILIFFSRLPHPSSSSSALRSANRLED